MDPTQNKHTPFFKGPPIGVPPPRHFQTPANSHISSHTQSQDFSFVNGLVEALYRPYARAEDRRTAAAQIDVKTLFSVQDGKY